MLLAEEVGVWLLRLEMEQLTRNEVEEQISDYTGESSERAFTVSNAIVL